MVVVVDIVNMMVVHQIPVFVKKSNELVSNGIKVWGVGRQLSCVMEWEVETYINFFMSSTAARLTRLDITYSSSLMRQAISSLSL